MNFDINFRDLFDKVLFESNNHLELTPTLLNSEKRPLPPTDGHTQVVAQWGMMLQLRPSAHSVDASKPSLQSQQERSQVPSNAQSAHGVRSTGFLKAFNSSREKPQPMVWRGELGQLKLRELSPRIICISTDYRLCFL